MHVYTIFLYMTVLLFIHSNIPFFAKKKTHEQHLSSQGSEMSKLFGQFMNPFGIDKDTSIYESL